MQEEGTISPTPELPNSPASISLLRSLLFLFLVGSLFGLAYAGPPNTFILSGPEGGVGHDHAEFWWTGQTDPGHRIFGYYYSLDDNPPVFTTRTSVRFYELSYQEHTFHVWAVDDALTEDVTPAEQTFAIVLTLQGELEFNDSLEDATSTIPNIRIQGRSFNDADEDWYRFPIQAKQLTLSFQRTSPIDGNPQLILSSTLLQLYQLPATDQPVAELLVNPNTSQRGTLSLGVIQGDYALRVSPTGVIGTSGETYAITLAESPMLPGAQWDTEPNPSGEQAQALSLNAEAEILRGFVLGRGDESSDQDWFKFHVGSQTAQRLRLRLSRPTATGETHLRLYRSLPIVSERQVSSLVINTATEQQGDLEVAVVLGDYFVQVEPSQETTDAVYQLSLEIDAFPPEVFQELEPNNVSPALNPSSPTRLSFGQPMRGSNWDGDADVDWFRMDVPAAGYLVVWASRPFGTGQTVLKLFSRNLAELSSTELGGDNEQLQAIAERVQAGTYYVQLIPQGENPLAAYELITYYLREAFHSALEPVSAGTPVELRVDWAPGNQVTYSVLGDFVDPRVGERLAELPLFDDGLHGDGQAGDGLYTSTYIPQQGDDVSAAQVQIQIADEADRTIAFVLEDPVQIDTVFPQIESVTHNGTGILLPGQELVVALVGEPGLSGFFDIEGFRSGLSLLEQQDGQYRGVYRVSSSDSVSGARLLSRLVDAAGNENSMTADILVNLASDGPVLQKLEHTAQRPLRLGEAFRVTLTAEPGLVTTFDFVGLRQSLPLYDDGTHSDGVAADGIYSADYTVREGDALQQGELQVTATNSQGVRSQLVHPRRITLDGVRPQSVAALQGSDRPEDQGGMLLANWAAVADADLAYYNLYVSRAPLVNTTGLTPAQQGLTEMQAEIPVDLNDTDYYIAVTAVDTIGNESLVLNESRVGPLRARDDLSIPPVAGLLVADTPDDSGNQVTLQWNPVDATEDFDYYAVYLALTPIVDDLSQAGVMIRENNLFLTVQDIPGLADGLDYYFAVTAFDKSGNQSRLGPGSVFGPVTSVDNSQDIDLGSLDFLIAPPGIVRDANVAFAWSRFTDGQPNAAYRYQLDSGVEQPIASSSLVLRNLSPGSHTLRISALDSGGRRLSTGIRKFTVAPFLLPSAVPAESSSLPRLPLNVVLNAQVGADGDRYQLVIPRSGVLNLFSLGDVRLYLSQGAQHIAQLLSSTGLIGRVESGEYELLVEGAGGYQISSTLTPLQPRFFTELEPNDGLEQAKALTPPLLRLNEGVEMVGAAKADGDIDWFSLAVSSQQAFRVRLTPIHPDTQSTTQIGIYTSDGKSQVSETAVLQSSLRQLEAVFPATTRQVWVQVQSGSTVSRYHIWASIEPVTGSWEFEPNDTSARATDTSLDSVVSGTHWSSQDTDWYRLNLSQSGILVATIASDADNPAPVGVLALRDSSMALLKQAEADAEGVLFIHASLGPGTYTLEFRADGDVADALAPYRLSTSLVLDASHTATEALQLGDTLDVSLQWKPGATISANLGEFQSGLPLYDDGLHSDGQAKDGLYAAKIPIPDGIQAQDVSLTADLLRAEGQRFHLTILPLLAIDTLTSPIVSVIHDAVKPLSLGQSFRVTIQATPGATASFDVAGARTGVPMFDDGLHGDGDTGDGVYAGQTTVLAGDDIVDAAVMAYLRHPSGRLLKKAASRNVTLDGVPPASPTGLRVSDVPEDDGFRLSLSWEPVLSSDLAYYEVFVSLEPIAVFDSLEPALTELRQTTATVSVNRNGTDYFVSAVAVDVAGNRSSLAQSSVAGPVQAMDDRAPDSVSGLTSFDTPNDAGRSVTLTWSQPSPASDFALYRVYQDTQSVDAAQESLVVLDIPLRSLISVDVAVPSNGVDYHFAVTVVDTSGNESTITSGSQTGPIQSGDDQTVPTVTQVRLLSMPPGLVRHSDVSFVWTRIAPGDEPSRLATYSYQLDGQQVRTTSLTQVQYDALTNGAHRFSVRSDQDSDWLTHHFTVASTNLVEREPNDTIGSAGSVALGRTMVGSLRTDPDLYRVDVSGSAVLEWLYRQSRGRTQVRIYQDVLAESMLRYEQVIDASLGQRTSTRLGVAEGTYWVELASLDSESPDYQFSVELLPSGAPWEIEANDAPEYASVLTPGREVRGSLQHPADVDWFSLEVPVPSSPARMLWVATRESGSTPLRVEWLTETLEPVAATSVDVFDEVPLTLRPGRYFVKFASEVPTDVSVLPSYSFIVQLSEPTGDEVEPNDSPLLASPLLSGQPVFGFHATGEQDQDWFRVELAASGVLVLDFAGTTETAVESLGFYNAQQQVIAELKVGPETLQQGQIALSLPSGSYFVRVANLNADASASLASYRLVALVLRRAQHDVRGILGVGDVLNVELSWKPGQNPRFSIADIASVLPLFDDGAHNDGAADDGVYTGSYVVQQGDLLADGEVLLHLQDASGKEVILRSQDALAGSLPFVSIDTVPPAVLAASHNAKGPLASGAEVRFTVQTESQAEAVVRVEGIGTPILLFDDGEHADAEAEDGTYSGVYQVSTQDNRADAIAQAEVTDVVGNMSTVVFSRRLTFDGVPPAILSVEHDAASELAEGDIITVTVLSEPGLEGTFAIGDFRKQLPLVAESTPETNPQTYLGQYTVRVGDRVLDAPVTVQLQDEAGNIAEAQATRLIRIDTTVPTIEQVALGVLGQAAGEILLLPAILPLGATLVVTLVAEADGTATFSIGNVREALPLFDDGAHQDGDAQDGTYRGQYTVQQGDAWDAFPVTVELTKANGKSVSRVAAQSLRVDTVRPAAVTGVVATDRPDDDGIWVILSWQTTQIQDFSHYHIYRSNSPIGVTAGRTPVQRIDIQNPGPQVVEVPQNEVNTYFAVVAVDRAGNESPLQTGNDGSVSQPVQALDNLAPAPVGQVLAIDTPGDAGGSISVSWAGPSVAEDFARTNIYLSPLPILTLEGLLPVTTIADRRLLNTDIRVGVDGVDYFVAVTVEDTSGNQSPLAGDSVAGPVQSLDDGGGIGDSLVRLLSGPVGQIRQNQTTFRWSRWSPEGVLFDGYFYQLDSNGFEFTRANQVSFYGLRDGTHQFMVKPAPNATPVIRTFSVLTTIVEENEPNDLTVSAHELALGVQVQGAQTSDADIDWYLIPRPSLDAPNANLNVNFIRPAGIGQTVITVFDAALPEESARLAERIVNAANRQRGQITIGVAFNDILIRVRSEGENPSALYQLSAVFQIPEPGYFWETETNDVAETATLISSDALEITGITNREGDVDWFRTQPSAVAQLPAQFLELFLVRPLSVGATQVRIYAGLPILSERQVGEFQLDPSVSQKWRWQMPASSSDLYIQVEHGPNTQGDSYTVRALREPIPVDQVWEAEPNGTPFAAGSLQLGRVMQGTSWHTSDDEDWFRLRIPEAGILSLGLERPSGAGQTQVRLLNAGQAEIAAFTVAPGSGQTGSISLSTTPGDYYVAVDPENEDTTLPYQLMALQVRTLDHDADDVLGLGDVLTVQLNAGGAAGIQDPTWSIMEDELPIFSELILRDDGLAGDIAPNDRIFTGTLTVPEETDVQNGQVVVRLHQSPTLLVRPIGDRTVVLDSVPPEILDFRHDAEEPLRAGRELTMRLVSEPGGEAFYELSSGEFRILDELFDDGQHDDDGVDDGVYGGVYTIQPGDDFDQVMVTGILQDQAGNEARKVALRQPTFDTRPPIIQSVTHDADGVLQEGALLKVQIQGEASGEAEFDLTGYKPNIPLYDDGTHGDLIPEDGIYTTAYFIEEGEQVQNTRVTGRLTDEAGNSAELSSEVLVTIDTVAPDIQTITHSAQRPLIRGEMLVVRLQGELNGKARFDIGDVLTNLPLADDGAGEDEQPNDGIYTGVYVVQLGDNVRKAVVTGYLVDESGNEEISHAAVPVTLDAVAPSPILDVTAEDLSDDEGHVLFVQWSPTTSSADFAHYNIYAERSPIRSTRVLIPVVTSLVLPEVTSAEIFVSSNNVTYYIAVTAVDTANNESEPAESSVAGPVQALDNIAPESVIVVSASDRAEDNGKTLSVSWTQVNTDDDFDRYEVYVDTQAIGSIDGLTPAAEFRNRNLVDVEVPVPEDGVDYHVAVVSRDINENPSPIDLEGRSVAGPLQSKDEVPPESVEGVIVFDTPADAGGSIGIAWEPRLDEGVREYRLYVDGRPFTTGEVRSDDLALVLPGDETDLVNHNVSGDEGPLYVAITAVDFGENESALGQTSLGGPVYPVDNRVSPGQFVTIAAGFDPLTFVTLDAGSVNEDTTLDIYGTVELGMTERIVEADHFLEPAHIDAANHDALASTLREVVLLRGELSRDITLQISYPELVAEDIEEDLRIFQLDTTGDTSLWQLVPGAQRVDATANTVSATISHVGVFRISRLQLPENLDDVVVFPNPFIPSESVSKRITFLNLTAQATIEIHTLDGRRVRTIDVPFSSGRASWDARNEAGEDVATGLYYYVVYSDTDKVVGRLMVVR